MRVCTRKSSQLHHSPRQGVAAVSDRPALRGTITRTVRCSSPPVRFRTMSDGAWVKAVRWKVASPDSATLEVSIDRVSLQRQSRLVVAEGEPQRAGYCATTLPPDLLHLQAERGRSGVGWGGVR